MRRLLAGAAGLLLLGAGPFDIPLLGTATAPTARGTARLVYAASPFGIAVTADGTASYDLLLDLAGLPEPRTLGNYQGYVAWATTTELTRWYRLGTVRNGTTRAGTIELNKFLVVVTAERDTAKAVRSGPTVLHGTSPSTLLQSFLSHPLFRGISP